jgi:NAD(P)H dehydrogenase (quinone)
MTSTILVTGASGKLGGGVVRHLLESNAVAPSRIIATTRNPDSLADLATRGVAVRYADFDDPPSLDRAFAGADKVLIVSTDALDLVGGKRLKQHEAAVAAVKDAGATHVAYTSMLKPEPGSPFVLADDHHGTEQAMIASGLSHTIFRPNSYHENLLTFLPNIVADGRWFTSAGDGRVAYAARDDMAAAIAGRLASDSADNAVFNLTGPKAYSNADVAELVSQVTGRPIEIVPVSDEALSEALTAALPEDLARLAVSVDVNVRMGNSELANDTIEELSHRRPMPLERFLEANRPALMG